MRRRRTRTQHLTFGVCVALLLPILSHAQSVRDYSNLVHPLLIEVSPDGSVLRYRIGQGAQLREGLWEIALGSGGAPRLTTRMVATAEPAPSIPGSPGASNVRRSQDGKKVAYLDADKDEAVGPRYLYCSCGEQSQGPQPVSRKPILAFEWTDDSEAFWVIASDGPDEPVGLLRADGRFEQITRTPALRRRGGFLTGGGAVAWVETDGSHYGRIWTRDRTGQVRMRVDPNPQVARWTLGTQEVFRWKNAAGEDLHGVLVRPNSKRAPLIVDPYSSGRNGFLNVAVMGNYIFVKEGFAVFLPNHRAPHTQPAAMFGHDYVGNAKDRDPVDVLVDDVMSGVNALVAQGVADPERMFLYGFSNGASAVNQLLPRTQAFRAAVSAGGVADWLTWYRERIATAGDLIASFLGGRRPADSPALYRRISPFYEVDKIKTPLLLAIGDKDTRYQDTTRFYEALRGAGANVTLISYAGDGHELSQKSAETYVRETLDFFRAEMKPKSPW